MRKYIFTEEVRRTFIYCGRLTYMPSRSIVGALFGSRSIKDFAERTPGSVVCTYNNVYGIGIPETVNLTVK